MVLKQISDRSGLLGDSILTSFFFFTCHSTDSTWFGNCSENVGVSQRGIDESEVALKRDAAGDPGGI